MWVLSWRLNEDIATVLAIRGLADGSRFQVNSVTIWACEDALASRCPGPEFVLGPSFADPAFSV